MEAVAGVLVPIFFFAMIAALVIVPRYFRSVERQKMAETLKAAIDKGQPLPNEVVEAISSGVRAPPSPQRDLRIGVIWLGLGLGLAGMGLAMSFDQPDATYPLLGVACFPIFVGLAFITMFLVNRNRQ